MARRTPTTSTTGTRRGRRVLAYVRVSDTRGREDTLLSPEIQMDQNRRAAAREDLEIVGEYVDLDKSGRTSTRREIATMIEQVQRGEADGILVWKISRWGRNTLDSLLNIGELQAAGGFIVSATESLDDVETPVGRFNLTIMLAIAAMFSDQQGETWREVHTYRTETLRAPAHGTARWGYTRVDKNTYAPDPVTGPALAEAYARAVAGEPVTRITNDFRARGLSTTRGKQLVPFTLRWILDSGFGAGLLTRGPRGERTYSPGAHPAVIDMATWKAYLATRTGEHHSATSGVRRLSGLLTCAGCQRPMLVVHATTTRAGQKVSYRRFVCRSQRAALFPTAPTCEAPAHVSEAHAETFVGEWLRGIVGGRDDAAAAMARAGRSSSAGRSAADCDREIARLTSRRKMLLERYLDGPVSADAYAAADAEMGEQIAALQLARTRAQGSARINALPGADVAEALLAGWAVVGSEEMNRAIRQVIADVTVARNLQAVRSPALEIRPAWSLLASAVA